MQADESAEQPWSVTLLFGGWVQVEAEGVDGSLFIRFVEGDDERLRARDLVLLGNTEVTSAELRDLPIQRLDAFINYAWHKNIRWGEAAERPAREVIADALVRSMSPDDPDGAQIQLKFTGQSIVRPRLQRPGGRDLPDSFFVHVAQAYHGAVFEGLPPARVMAEEAGVSIHTARGWVAEARKRGFLPRAAGSGRAG